MTRCECGHYHVLACKQCGCKTFVADTNETILGPDWPLAGGGKDSYRYEAVQALRGDLSL